MHDRGPGAPDLSPNEARAGAPGVTVTSISSVPPIDDPLPEPRPELPEYRGTVDRLAGQADGPVVCLPTLSAECFGLFAALAREQPGRLRIVGWMHSAIPYDLAALRRYEPMIHRFVAVSSRCARMITSAMPGRAADTSIVHYGVPVPDAPPARPSGLGRALRLIYSGRMDYEQKRLPALLAMSRSLRSGGVEHELELIGDGPLSSMVDEAARSMPWITRLAAMEHAMLARRLGAADIFVLASKYEGLSIAMLEAMARGCVPVVTEVSGSADALGPVDARGVGRCGIIVPCPDGHDEGAVGQALAEGVRRAMCAGLGGLSAEAHRVAVERFSLPAMCDAAASVIDAAGADDPRPWPDDVPACACSFTVPPDALDRACGAFTRLSRRRVALWGAGRHTLAIADAARRSGVTVVGVIDDDTSRHGQLVAGWPIVPAPEIAALGATDVVISSALHERAMWDRRGELERLGLNVHRLYAS